MVGRLGANTTPVEVGSSSMSNRIGSVRGSGGKEAGAPGRPAAVGGMVVLAPVFLDSRDFVSAAGEIDYEAIGQRLRELQGGI